MTETNSGRNFCGERLLAKAEDIFQDKDEALRWLKTPKKALSGKAPLELAGTEEGVKQVIDLLGRIEHGVFT
ncbi:MbcA/ParS/Xre antitoxin family protein [uncultured Methylophaga sp.]|uniref:MbcA/ParS/Xre antitoxin family protein n=1 Tax=uncultured Methylophaga sp. TaxID=285271 RepID=UPI002605BBED|nr:MbcA/ParS/Xre antitoxin family protein [uncultured Methylophaga sp.]